MLIYLNEKKMSVECIFKMYVYLSNKISSYVTIVYGMRTYGILFINIGH